MKSKDGTFRIASFSDVHTGHHNTPTTEILDQLRIAFPGDAETAKLDLITIPGDFFDRLLTLTDPNVFHIKSWVNSFLRMAKRLDIVVIVLKGTPSHDWDQSQVFVSENVNAMIECELYYVDKLDILTVDSLDATFLCVPDEWLPEPDDTWNEVTQLMQRAGLDKVDFALMHGTFPHQLPGHIKTPRHNPERYLSIVRYYIFVGHIHKHSVWERIISQGSFSRLCHNEEEAKGHVLVNIKENGENEIIFVENKGARIYKTIDCRGLSAEAVLQLMSATVPQYPEGSFIRIRANPGDPALASLKVLQTTYLGYNWSTPKVDANTTATAKEIQQALTTKFQAISITPENIVSLVIDKIKQKSKNANLIDHCQLLLEGVIQNDTRRT